MKPENFRKADELCTRLAVAKSRREFLEKGVSQISCTVYCAGSGNMGYGNDAISKSTSRVIAALLREDLDVIITDLEAEIAKL